MNVTHFGSGELKPTKGWLAQQRENVDSLLHPFSDKAINAKLLALCLAQALCSVATLIHDTYLPIYLQDVLGKVFPHQFDFSIVPEPQ